MGQLRILEREPSKVSLSATVGGEMAALYLDSFERVWARPAPLA
jgi:hypothetical protein